jgi:hypothetical protein
LGEEGWVERELMDPKLGRDFKTKEKDVAMIICVCS